MPPSSPDGARARPAFTIVEVLVIIGVLAVVAGAVLPLFTSSHRIAHSARRLTDVTLHAQSLLEALGELSLDEFPDVPAGARTVLFEDDGPALSGGSPRFQEVAEAFKKPPPLEMKRVVTAERLETGEVLLHFTVTWKAITGEQATEQVLVLPMLATPRNWQ